MAQTNPYYQGPLSDHFDGLRFFIPGQPSTDRSLADILRWKLREKAAQWPKKVEVVSVVPEWRVDRLTVTMVGHATLLVQAAGRNMLTDPVWSRRASPLSFAGPKRVTDAGIRFDKLPQIDTVLLSHNHYDHLDVTILRRLVVRDDPLIVTPLGNDVIVRRHVPSARLQIGDWGDHFDLDEGFSVDLVPANHWSSCSTSDRRMALWCGFMLRTPAGLVYFAGDTGYGGGAIFRAMHQRYGSPDVAIIPIGAYAPRWFMAQQHCDPSEAVQIMLDLDASRAFGIHWGTFQLTDEPREEPAELLRAALTERGVDATRFIAARPGDQLKL